MSYYPTANGYFTGGGGFEIGMMQSGIRVQQSLDLDRDAIECMQLNQKYFGHRIRHRNIMDITVNEQDRADIAIGTYPCTKYSTIADIHHTRTGDDLFLHFFRHIVIGDYEMFVVENVPGMLKFPVVMEAMTQLPNYYVTVVCPVSAHYWLPQKRDRLIIIGTKKPFNVPQPKEAILKPSIKNILDANPVYEMPDYVVSRIKGSYRDLPIIVDPEDSNALAPTCVAHYAKDLGTRLVKDRSAVHGLRPFSIREYGRLQGFPEDYIFPNKRSSYKLIGNAVPVPMGRWAGDCAMKYFNQKAV